MTTTPSAPLATGRIAQGPLFDHLRALGIVRPDRGRRVAGVAAGLATRWDVDPAAVRLWFGLLTLLGGIGLALYGLGWLLLPHPDGRIHAEQALTGTVTTGFVGALLTLLGPGSYLPATLLIVAVLGVATWRASRRRPRLVNAPDEIASVTHFVAADAPGIHHRPGLGHQRGISSANLTAERALG